MAEEPKGGILRLLKRTARTASSTVTGKSASDENALWATHEAALGGAREAAQATQRMAGELARQRTALDGATDHGRTALLRLQDASTVVARVRETFERLGLVALNAGLEGARFGEPVGQALRLVADDVRSHASRGTDALRDVDTLLGEVSGELGVLQGSLDRGRTVAIALGDDAQAGGAAAQLAETRLEELPENREDKRREKYRHGRKSENNRNKSSDHSGHEVRHGPEIDEVSHMFTLSRFPNAMEVLRARNAIRDRIHKNSFILRYQ